MFDPEDFDLSELLGFDPTELHEECGDVAEERTEAIFGALRDHPVPCVTDMLGAVTPVRFAMVAEYMDSDGDRMLLVHHPDHMEQWEALGMLAAGERSL